MRKATARVAKPVSTLAVFGDLVAAQDTDSQVSLFDASKASALRQCGQGGPPGCRWFDLNHAESSLDSGLWIPLDGYGATWLPVGK